MREIIESLTTCAIISVYIVVGIAIGSAAVSLFGVGLRQSRTIAILALGLIFIFVSFSQLLNSSQATQDMILFVVFLAFVGAGSATAYVKPYRARTRQIAQTHIWSVFGLLAFVMAAIVGGGYPANPLGVVDLVDSMRQPVLAIFICVLAFLLGLGLNTEGKEEQTKEPEKKNGNKKKERDSNEPSKKQAKKRR